VAAAVTHAIWNLLSKQARPSASFFLVSSVFGCLLLLPVALYNHVAYAGFPARVWASIVATGFFLAGYYVALSAAYRSGDMSVAYPLARSSPVIVVTVATLVLGQGDQVSLQCIVGIGFVVIGCFLLPMKRFTEFRIANYLNATCLFALLAALGSAGYSMVDDAALRCLRQTQGLDYSNTTLTLLYAFAEAVSALAWLGLWVALRRGGGDEVKQVIKRQLGRSALTGIGIYVTYSMVLISMAFVSNVSYVVGFRQLSVLIGAVLGIRLLGEASYRPRLVGAFTMFVGLVLIGLG